MKLAPKLTILFLLLAILPAAIVGYLAYENGRQTIIRVTTDHLMSTNTLKSSELRRWIKDSEKNLEEFAQRPLVVENTAVMNSHDRSDPAYRKAHKNLIEGDLKPRMKVGGFLELFILSPRQGYVLSSTTAQQEGKYRETQPYFLEGKNRTYVQGSYYSTTLEQPAMTVSTPIKDRQGNLMAVLAGRLDLGELSKIMILQSGKSSTQETYLVNTFNFFVTESRFGHGYVLKKTVRTEGVKAGLSGRDGFGFYKDYRGESVIGAYKWLPEFKMCIMTEIDQAEAFAPVVHLAWVIAGTALIICLVAAFLGLFLARTISRPLRRLAAATEEIGAGKLEYRVGMDSKDEIGELSRAFDRMARELKTTTVSLDEFSREKDFSDSVINSLPGVFYLIDEEGRFIRWNKNFEQVTGYSSEEFSRISPLDLFSGKDKELIDQRIQEVFIKGEETAEADLTTKRGHTIPYFFTGLRRTLGGKVLLAGVGVDITARKKAEEEIQKLNEELEKRIGDRTAQLEAINKELEAFSYSVSHDLRAPLRGIDGISLAILEDYSHLLDDQGKDFLNRLRRESRHMAGLIDDLLKLSRVTRSELQCNKVNLSALSKTISEELKKNQPERQVEFVIQPEMIVDGDANLLRIALDQLLNNAWKFTGKHPRARIEVGMIRMEGETAYFVGDDGAGFNMNYANHLFGAFQRFHTTIEFEGTGIGLATVKRIIHHHGGRVWGEGAVEGGATFYFTIP